METQLQTTLESLMAAYPRYAHVWDIGFGNGESTEVLARFADVVIAVEIDPKFIRKFPANVIPIIASINTITRGIVAKTIPLVYVDVGDNADTFRYVFHQLVGRAEKLLVRNYPWLTDVLTQGEFRACLTPHKDYTEVKWIS